MQCAIAGNIPLAYAFSYGGAALGWLLGTARFHPRDSQTTTVVAA